ncbi:MAG: YraN family protein [candidate division Zixibacteria bacterium]|nr:YraN family protein [candidate division Zixibacteria bacterium]
MKLGIGTYIKSLFVKNLSPKQLGKKGEAVAVNFLKKKHYQLVERNYRISHYEFDCIVKDGDYIVFVEVKTGSTNEFGDPAEWVTSWKKKRMINAARIYLQKKGLYHSPARFDVVVITSDSTNYKIRHIENAFELMEN